MGDGLHQKGPVGTLHLVDGSGYIFRAYHAIRPMRNAAGQPIHAVLGVTRMLIKLIKDHHPTALAVVFDAGRSTARLAMYPEYKANRDTPPDDLKVQIPLCHQAVEALGVRQLQMPGIEADDVLATLTTQAVAQGMDVCIVSGDKDLMQLVGPHVHVLRYSQRTETDEHVDEEGVRRYFGVGPAQVADVLALMGDTSDNVPGVDGVGEKTARELVAQFGSVEQVLAAAPSMKAGKRRDTLIAQKERALLSKRLVTLAMDVPIQLQMDQLRLEGLDVPNARAFFAHMGFKALLADPMFATPQDAPAGSQAVLPLHGGAGAPVAAPAPSAPVAEPGGVLELGTLPEAHHQTVDTPAALDALVARLAAAPLLAVDGLGDGADALRAPLVALGVCWAPGQAACIPVGQGSGLWDRGLPPALVAQKLGPVLADKRAVTAAHDAKALCKLAGHNGLDLQLPAHDVELASYALARSDIHDLLYVAQRHLKVNIPTLAGATGKGRSAVAIQSLAPEVLRRLMCHRADAVLQLTPLLDQALRADGLWDLYLGLEMPLAQVLLRMERAGVRVDVAQLAALETQALQTCARLEQEVHQLAGGPFNLGSPKQLQEVLFTRLALPVGRRTKTGPSTDQDVLESLSELHPLPAKVLEHRHLQKLVGTYLQALPALINPDTGRIHTTYQQAVAATGRLSSKDPNLQNIPIRDDFGRQIRSAFVAPPGHVLISADYSQIELRILAHVSGDPVLKQAFERGEDVHARTASEVLGIALADVTRDQRRAAKTINFGLLYGMSAFGLSQALKIPRAEAKEYLERYYARLVGVQAWQSQVLEDLRASGYVTTLFGRRRYLPDIHQRNYQARQAAERMAINTPIQGAAADIIKRATVALQNRLDADAPGARLILQVHDELVLECPQDDQERVSALVKQEMEGAAQLSVKLDVETGAGTHWGLAHG